MTDYIGTIHVTEDELTALKDRDNDLSAYISRELGITDGTESIGDVRPRFTDAPIIDTHYFIRFDDRSDDDWYDGDWGATLEYYNKKNVERMVYLKVNIIDADEADTRLTDLIDSLRDDGYTDAEISALLEHRGQLLSNPDGY